MTPAPALTRSTIYPDRRVVAFSIHGAIFGKGGTRGRAFLIKLILNSLIRNLHK